MSLNRRYYFNLLQYLEINPENIQAPNEHKAHCSYLSSIISITQFQVHEIKQPNELMQSSLPISLFWSNFISFFWFYQYTFWDLREHSTTNFTTYSNHNSLWTYIQKKNQDKIILNSFIQHFLSSISTPRNITITVKMKSL